MFRSKIIDLEKVVGDDFMAQMNGEISYLLSHPEEGSSCLSCSPAYNRPSRLD